MLQNIETTINTENRNPERVSSPDPEEGRGPGQDGAFGGFVEDLSPN